MERNLTCFIANDLGNHIHIEKELNVFKKIEWKLENFLKFKEDSNQFGKLYHELDEEGFEVNFDLEPAIKDKVLLKYCDHMSIVIDLTLENTFGLRVYICAKLIKNMNTTDLCECNILDKFECCECDECYTYKFTKHKCYIKLNNELYELIFDDMCDEPEFDEDEPIEHTWCLYDDDLKLDDDVLVIDLHLNFNYKIMQCIQSHPYEDYLGDKNFNELKIICSDGIILYANRLILAMNSSVFRTMFQTNMIESEMKEVVVNDIDSKTMQEFLRFAYSSKIENLDYVAESLLYCAEKYEVNDLKNTCIAHLIKNLKKDNVFEILQLAEMLNLKIMMNQCLNFICKSFEKVEDVNEFDRLNESLKKKVIEGKCKMFIEPITTYVPK
ncbi:hypothetical protein PVAND_000561 [Polypedilum vanderplanki]|uniref:BTB domain-containing protein n=1 Tax=Polypedilum vanderplanki TaxID=319348 RepID=A0A9J6BKC1_POLVA|nr:hypothetical protein PVAND_000561 [Polypedilum vanderplanki]